MHTRVGRQRAQELAGSMPRHRPPPSTARALLPVRAPITRMRPSMPPSRSASASPAVAVATHSAPPRLGGARGGERLRGRSRRPSPRRTARRPGALREQRAVAADRARVDMGDRASGAHRRHPLPAAPRSRRPRSRGRRPAARRRDGPAPWAMAPARRPRTGRDPLRGARRSGPRARPRCPRSRVPGVPPGLTTTRPAGLATRVSSPFSSTTAPLSSAASRALSSRCALHPRRARARAAGPARQRAG